MVVTPREEKVNPAELEQMYVGGDAAYVPTETWRGAGDEACRCEADYSVACD